jgi:hypothetical protein
MKPAHSGIQRELDRLARYDDESIVHEHWIHQRYDGGYAAHYAPARTAAVVTAWHEAGHAVAALTVGARFSSASIRHCDGSAGRVRKVAADSAVIAAAGEIAEFLRDWSLPADDAGLRSWLTDWKGGGDARLFRRTARADFGDEVTAWRHAESLLTPQRMRIRQVARALLVHPRYLSYEAVSAIAGTTRETR